MIREARSADAARIDAFLAGNAATTRAVLFANNAAAARAYEAIGFNRIGQYRVALFETPQIVKAAP